jgi:hypothetical protein
MCKMLASAFVGLALAFGLCASFRAIAADDEHPAPKLTPSPNRGASSAATPTAKPNDQSAGNGGQSAYERIMRALDEPTEMDYVETQLVDVVQAIKIKHGIEIMLDTHGLTDAGVNADTPITFRSKGISLRSALRSMLRDHELTFLAHNEALVITCQEGGAELRLYDVGDFLRNGWSIDEVAEAVRFALNWPVAAAPQTDSRRDGARGGRASLPLPAGSARNVQFSLASQAAVGSSNESGILPLRGILLVRTNDRGHMDVSNLLAELRHRIETKNE